MHEQYVNEAKRNLETVAYRNKQATKLENFVAKFTQAVDELEKHNKGLHNTDVVDLIWTKMMNPELRQYVTSLKVKFQLQPQDYQDTLQGISRQVPSLNVPNIRKASEVST